MSMFDAFGNMTGLANAQQSFNQTQNFLNNQNSFLANQQAQNQALTAGLTQQPAYYAQQGANYMGQIGAAQPVGTYSPGSGLSSFSGKPLWSRAEGGGGGGGDVWSQGAPAVPYLGQTNDFWGLYNQQHGGMSSYAPNSVYSPSQYTPTPQTPMWGSPGMSPGYNPDQFMPHSTAWESYGQPGVGGAGGSPPIGQGNNQAALWGYLQANPDVMQAAQGSGQDIFSFANQHLNTYGKNEGRGMGDPSGFQAAADQYLKTNADVAAAGMNAWDHWNQYGKNEGRSFGDMAGGFVGAQGPVGAGASPSEWGTTAGGHVGAQGSASAYGGTDPWQQYLNANPDVAKHAKDNNLNAQDFAQQHYTQYGKNEGRQGYGLRDDLAGMMNQGFNTAGGSSSFPKTSQAQGIQNSPFAGYMTPSKYLENNFGEFNKNVSPVLGDRLRGQGPPSISQYVLPTAKNWGTSTLGR